MYICSVNATKKSIRVCIQDPETGIIEWFKEFTSDTSNIQDRILEGLKLGFEKLIPLAFGDTILVETQNYIIYNWLQQLKTPKSHRELFNSLLQIWNKVDGVFELIWNKHPMASRKVNYVEEAEETIPLTDLVDMD